MVMHTIENNVIVQDSIPATVRQHTYNSKFDYSTVLHYAKLLSDASNYVTLVFCHPSPTEAQISYSMSCITHAANKQQ